MWSCFLTNPRTKICICEERPMDNQEKKPALTPEEIAKQAGVSISTVYYRAAKLGRLPTVEEAKPKPGGRPRKYF